MSRNKSFYITTTLPYVNAEPHVGHAMEIIHADIIARFKQLSGCKVFFNTGTDEHGQKVWQKTVERGMNPQKYVDECSNAFKNLMPLLGISEDVHFIRTSDEKHKKAAQELWVRCRASGDIYKKNYKVNYCVGCELEKTDSEIENGRCAIHRNLELEIREEENYFFKFSKYSDRLLGLYENNPDFVIPNHRLNEIRALIDRGLEDFSISRLKEKMPWGVEVPDDPEHVMYVWFDALVNYISTLGWPENTENYEQFWVNGTPTQFAGKDQLRQQAAMWQAMLMSAGVPNTRHLVIHGFINYEGQKMSKSLGNVVSPDELVSKYGIDTLRYFVSREFNQFEDTDISRSKLLNAYNANLANGLGNLVSRIMKLAETHLDKPIILEKEMISDTLHNFLDNFEIQKAMNHIWENIGELDALIQEKKPWESKDKDVIADLVARLASIGYSLTPFMPMTSEKILKAISDNKMPTKSLFPRIESEK